jgi:hypothetical protein
MADQEDKPTIYAIRVTDSEKKKVEGLLGMFPTLSRNKLMKILIELADENDVRDYVLGKEAALALS